jgi:hypothetical protein
MPHDDANGHPARVLRGSNLLLTNGAKAVGLYLAVHEATHRPADHAVLAFCAVCVLGAQVIEEVLLRVIDRFFGGEKGP